MTTKQALAAVNDRARRYPPPAWEVPSIFVALHFGRRPTEQMKRMAERRKKEETR